MHANFNSTVFQRVLVVAISVVALAWFLIVPVLMTSSAFVALCGLLAASAWILKTAYVNAQPASSLAQSLHDAEVAAAAAATTPAPKVR